MPPFRPQLGRLFLFGSFQPISESELKSEFSQMPKAGVKQKTPKRVKSSRSPFEKTDFSNRLQEDQDVDMDGPSQDEEEIPEKDETEQKLEKLLFGDDQGFHSALRDHQDREMMVLSEGSDEEGDGEDKDEAEDHDLDDVADADVRYAMRRCFLLGTTTNSGFYSSSSLILGLRQLLRILISVLRLRRTTKMEKVMVHLQHGTIAMTSVSPFR